ncbi:MAG: hypothetical protein WAT78_13410 [Rhizobiaceae bacterium]
MKRLISFAILACLPLSAAFAADGKPDRFVTDELTKTECSACHIAFPPRLLPATSWDAMMGGLAEHFGENAALDAASTEAIRAYLNANAGKPSAKAFYPDGKPMLRISELSWFVHEHGAKMSAKEEKKAGTWANCAACHAGAEKGQFDDD